MPSIRPLRPIRDEALADLRSWYPKDRWASDPPPDDLFEIGLTIAGGQSAGCYLAGVLDFLFEALDSWHAARRADPDKFPNHRVKIKIIVGASAGGLNAALAAICGRHRFAPASHHKFEDGDKNLTSPFYRAWVRDIDITNLLSADDLGTAKMPFSFLNTDYLEGKVASYLGFSGAGVVDRDWLEDPLPVKIAISNLDGVPYQIRFSADLSEAGNAALYRMSLHRDYLAFLRPIANNPQIPAIPDHDVLAKENNAADASWRRLGQAVLATIAFPFALKQRVVDRPGTDYDYRFVYPFAPGGLVYAPSFPGQRPQQTQFTSLDGGVMDNEPFDLAHAALAGSAGENKREGKLAKRAIILIDPFVSPKRLNANDATIAGFATKFWNALVSQSRFDPIDLSLAEATDVYSRFMIAPARHEPTGTIRGDNALASHPLDAFFGYFSEHYRHHDFMLGRLNCYMFLRDWFVLPSRHSPDSSAADPELGNTLFVGWPWAALANSAFKSTSRYRPDHRQIIPLVGTAAQEPGTYPWPAGKFAGYSAVKSSVEARVKALFPQCRDQFLNSVIKSRTGRWIGRLAANIYWWWTGRRQLLTAIERKVEEARQIIDRE